jgi:hypothetical protein
MAQMYDFGACVLEDAAHYIYGRIMAVKKRCGRDYPDGMF